MYIKKQFYEKFHVNNQKYNSPLYKFYPECVLLQFGEELHANSDYDKFKHFYNINNFRLEIQTNIMQ